MIRDDSLDFAAGVVANARDAGADGAEALNTTNEMFEINFETGEVTLLRSTAGETTSVTVFRDGRKGSTEFSGRDEAEIRDAVQRAIEGAGADMSDEANGVASPNGAAGGTHGALEPDKDDMLEKALAHIETIDRDWPLINMRNAIYRFDRVRRSFANSADVALEETRGAYGFNMTFGARDGEKATSFAGVRIASWEPFESLIETGLLKRRLEETVQSLEPQPVPEKFVGDIIITPECMPSIVMALARALSGYSVIAGTTPFLDRVGETIAADSFSLLNRPTSDAFPDGADFDDNGVGTCDLPLIEAGVLRNFLVDLYSSRKLGRDQTAGKTNFIVPSGETPLEEIIAGTERGILFRRFSGGVPTNSLDFSGVAKNSFYIEDGEIRHPLIETMVAGNFLDVLKNVRAISRESLNGGGSEYPYMAAGGVTVSGK